MEPSTDESVFFNWIGQCSSQVQVTKGVSNGYVLILSWKSPNESFVDIDRLSAKEDVSKQLLVANIRLSILTLYQYVHSKKVRNLKQNRVHKFFDIICSRYT